MGRRTVLKSAAALAVGKLALEAARRARRGGAAATGDFAFLAGEWRIANRMKQGDSWIEFPGEATVHSLLAGNASIEELRIPARNFSGIGLRLYDAAAGVWNDHWVNGQQRDGERADVRARSRTASAPSSPTTRTMAGRSRRAASGTGSRRPPAAGTRAVSRDGGATWDDELGDGLDAGEADRAGDDGASRSPVNAELGLARAAMLGCRRPRAPRKRPAGRLRLAAAADRAYAGKQDDIHFVSPDIGWYGNGAGKLYRTLTAASAGPRSGSSRGPSSARSASSTGAPASSAISARTISDRHRSPPALPDARRRRELDAGGSGRDRRSARHLRDRHDGRRTDDPRRRAESAGRLRCCARADGGETLASCVDLSADRPG